MSLLGIDIGTTGCKAAVFSETGDQLAIAYQEYDHQHPKPGWAELDSVDVWNKTKQVIKLITQEKSVGEIKALSVSSLGEAVVPITKNREILGPSILNYCQRGQAYYEALAAALSSEELYTITGITLGTHFTWAKLMWTKKHHPDIYQQADYFLPWTSFISFMLGADAYADYSLVNRTQLFDINQLAWSEQLLDLTGIDINKLPIPVHAGYVIGELNKNMAEELGLPPGLPISMGTHDQCANAVGCGVIKSGQAMLGLGTFTCATPVFDKKFDTAWMISKGLNTEHHAIPGQYVSFIYNQGGSVVKWYRDTFARYEHQLALENGSDIYQTLFAEMPKQPSNQMVLPYLSTTGLPDFSAQTSGVLTGIRLTTNRGEILKGIIEGIMLDLKVTIDFLAEADFNVKEFVTVGGGSKSNAWVQVCADILGRKMVRPKVIESGTLGSAIIAGVGSGIFSDYESAVNTMVKMDETFMPGKANYSIYQGKASLFIELRQTLNDYLKKLSIFQKN